MSRKERIVCQCGGQLTRPIPRHCPHCGAVIASVKHRWWPRIYPLLLIGAMFALLVAFVLWMTGNL